MDPNKQWWIEERAKKTIDKLVAHDFKAVYVKSKAEAVEEIWKHVTPNQTVGVGGSITIRDLGILERLEAQSHTIFDHWKPGISKEESLKIRKTQQSCDVFLTSANAITLNGEIVNIDGFCNRIAAMTFGPGEVIIVAGKNKIVKDLPEAIARIKDFVAPMNAKRFGADTPCAKTGRCVDCDSPQRICRGTLILERRPFGTDILVMIVMEDLGY